MQIRFHSSQRPAEVRARLIDAVRAKRIPGRFLYDSPGQAARYLAYQRAWSPRNLGTLYDLAFASVIRRKAAPFRWVGLGCGGGARDARFVELARVPALLADTSPSLLLEALEKIPGAEAIAIDLDVEPERDVFGEESAVFGAIGLLPNFEPARFLAWLRRLLRPHELLLLSANLGEERSAILPQYDNDEARAWYAGALAELGAFDVDLEVRATGGDDVWRIEVEARARRDHELRIFDALIPVGQGDALSVFTSNRFAPRALPSIFAAAGLDLLDELVHESREEGVYVLGRSGAAAPAR
jgi:SAM-dependent methyltransferase